MLSLTGLHSEDRTWTNVDGRQIKAKAFNKTKLSVILKLATGARYEIQLTELVPADQDFVNSWMPKRPLDVSEDAVFHDGSWYAFVIGKNISFTLAQQKAKQMGGHLAWVMNKETQEVVQKLAGGSYAWLGASDEGVEGQWQWTNGEKLVFSNWDKGQPNNHQRREHFLHLWKNGRWNDLPKTGGGGVFVAGFIVEWNP